MSIFNCCKPKYDVPYCSCTNCNARHPTSKVKRARCQEVVNACNGVCGPLASWGQSGFTLYYDCLKFVNANPAKYANAKEYACAEIGGQVLFTDYGGLTPCADFNPQTDTQDGKNAAVLQMEQDAAAASQGQTVKFLIFAAIVLLVILFIRRNNRSHG